MSSSHRLVIKDAIWQLIGRIISAAFGFLIIKIMTPYLGPLRYGDYSTILKYFAIWTALADLWLYVLAVKQMWAVKEEEDKLVNSEQLTTNNRNAYPKLRELYGKFVWTRVILMWVVYTVAIVVAYLVPAYTSNPYLIWWLPLGMIFSASFMFAGIQQLPLQLFWKMKELSMTLITARISQLIILVPVVYFFFSGVEFNGWTVSILAFCLVLFSVVASGIGQNREIHRRAKKILPLKIKFDWKFTKEIVGENWQYGVSYYLSSFHTLLVLIFLWWYFPTSSWHDYTGMRALSLALIEILLIIPSSLGNSLLHKISGYSLTNKLKSMGNLMILIFWIGALITINFAVFPEYVIQIVSWKAFMWSFVGIRNRGSDQVLPFLWIVLGMSFIKQVYNYLFVAVWKQNVLLPINLIWVVLGVGLGIRVIPRYGLLGWVITQLFIEFMFMVWAMCVAYRKKVSPIISWKKIWILTALLSGLAVVGAMVSLYLSLSLWQFFLVAAVLNGVVILLSLPVIRKVARGLTVDSEEPSLIA